MSQPTKIKLGTRTFDSLRLACEYVGITVNSVSGKSTRSGISKEDLIQAEYESKKGAIEAQYKGRIAIDRMIYGGVVKMPELR